MATAPEPNDSIPTSVWPNIDKASVSVTKTWNVTYTDAYGIAVEHSAGHITATVDRQSFSIVLSCMEDRPITSETLRWVAERKSHQDTNDKMIILSYLNNDTINYHFFKGSTDLTFIELNALVRRKFEHQPTGQAEAGKVIDSVTSQPIYMNTKFVSIKNIRDSKTSEYSEYMVVIDLECLSLFSRSLQPLHQLMFWQQPGHNSVERVKLMSEKDIDVYTETKTFKFKADEDHLFIEKIRMLSPKKKHLFTDINAMMTLFGGSNPTAGSAGENVPHRENVPHWAFNIPEATDRWGPNVAKLISELDSAVDAFTGVEDMELLWIATEHDIKDTIENSYIPQTDHTSGGLNPDSFEHLERSLQDIEDQFKENNIPVAISRLRACRELFISGNIYGVHRLFERDDMSLLKALYMKSLQS